MYYKKKKKRPVEHECSFVGRDQYGKWSLYPSCRMCDVNGEMLMDYVYERALLDDVKRLARFGLTLDDCAATPEVRAEVMALLGRAKAPAQPNEPWPFRPAPALTKARE